MLKYGTVTGNVFPKERKLGRIQDKLEMGEEENSATTCFSHFCTCPIFRVFHFGL